MSANQQKISVVIPLFNQHHQIDRALESVFAQNFKNFEIIVVDYGSSTHPDNNETINEYYNFLLKYRGHKIRLVHEVNNDYSKACNCGVHESRYDLIAFLDVEDRWEPHYLEEIIHLSDECPEADCFGTGYQFVTNKGDFVDAKIRIPRNSNRYGIFNRYFETGASGDQPFIFSSFSVRRQSFNRIGKFNEGQDVGFDQDFFSRAALIGKIAYSPNISAFHYLDENKEIKENDVPSEECQFSKHIYNKAILEVADSDLKSAMIDYTAAHLLHIASLNIAVGRISYARSILQDGRCKRYPLRFLWWLLKLHFASNYDNRKPDFATTSPNS